MKNIVFIIFAIHILKGREEVQQLPPLGWYQSLKKTSDKNIILTGLGGSILGVLAHKYIPKNKSWLKKALTGIAIFAPMSISAGRSIYFGKANYKIFYRDNPYRDNPLFSTKHNILLARFNLLHEAKPKEGEEFFDTHSDLLHIHF